ncbi:MAG: UDP-N-acetylmuramoyl-L-alanyl-D-glutamate--2,6-diaminopimelate ligase, partial [Deltaproteobacteria bacterium]|nr:UDP-N-acetylmuramoyl-L-alanyl-D-glutamate--2,6-diaminopimelate ligase [Deltaproteobacteria bacterium]
MRLDALSHGLPVTVLRGGDAEIRALTLDSRRTGPGALFAAAVDPIRNGEAFAPDAAARGAAILAASDLVASAPAVAVAPNVREVFGLMAHRLAGDPTRGMTRVGVTGTNGKTTFTYLMEAILERAARRPGIVGTVSYRYAGITESAPNTTPEASDLAALFARMRDAGVDAVVMEASSHGLALSRVAGLSFDLAAFTNLSRDHLDFHRDEADYLAAKTRLFTDYLAEGGACVVNADDPAGRAIAARARGRVRLYGAASDAHYRIASYACDAAGVRVDLVTPAGELHVTRALAGHYQV